MKEINSMDLVLAGRSVNESFARVSVAAFLAQLDPTLQEIAEVKTIVSEAVTNSIVHGYAEKKGSVQIKVRLYENNRVRITIRDKGKGIENITQAMQPCFTTGGEERAGMGFSIMQSFSDRFRVRSVPGKGTTVIVDKYIGQPTDNGK